jgi:hypothetical protein
LAARRALSQPFGEARACRMSRTETSDVLSLSSWNSSLAFNSFVIVA